MDQDELFKLYDENKEKYNQIIRDLMFTKFDARLVARSNYYNNEKRIEYRLLKLNSMDRYLVYHTKNLLKNLDDKFDEL